MPICVYVCIPVEALEQPEGDVDDDGLPVVRHLNLLGRGDEQVLQVRLHVRLNLQIEDGLQGFRRVSQLFVAVAGEREAGRPLTLRVQGARNAAHELIACCTHSQVNVCTRS